MLTSAAARAAKGAAKQYKLTDGRGLYLMVLPTGNKSWRLDYQIAGRRKTLTLGRFPTISLAEARKLAEAAREDIARGIDPAITRKINKANQYLSAGDSFERVAREWAEMHLADKSNSHIVRSTALLNNDLIPPLGGIPIRDLTLVMVLGALRRVEVRSVDMSHRAKVLVGQVLRYAVATGRAERDFTPDLKGALKSHRKQHYAAITDPDRFLRLMYAIEHYPGTLTIRNGLRLAPLLMLRPGEQRNLCWEHVNWEAAQLELPVGYMKSGERAHIVPLSTQALAIFREQQRFNGRFEPVFPSGHSRRKSMSENGMRKALRVLGYTNADQTVHGFRASARTIMEEVLGERADLLEHQLHHVIRDTTQRAYNRATHIELRRAMLQRWADWIEHGLKKLGKEIGNES